jgi:hypothetical protein
MLAIEAQPVNDINVMIASNRRIKYLLSQQEINAV